MAAGRRQALRTGPRHHGEVPRALRMLQLRQRAISLGRLNNTQEFSLTADGLATTTVIQVPGVRASSVVTLMPVNQDAAAALPSTWPVCTRDTITIHHLPTSVTRTYRFALFA